MMSVWRAVLWSLALGIVLTITVAMVLALRTETLMFDPALTVELRRQQWDREDRTDEDAPKRESVWIAGVWTSSGLDAIRVERHRSDEKSVRTWRYESGWPRRALSGVRTSRSSGDSESALITGLIPLDEQEFKFVAQFPDRVTSWGTRPKAIPFAPAWPGFAINMFIYAAGVLLIWTLLYSARRLMRKWRGRCPRCGYNLRRRVTAGCPECG